MYFSPRSSAGQSNGLLSRRPQVRILPRVPKCMQNITNLILVLASLTMVGCLITFDDHGHPHDHADHENEYGHGTDFYVYSHTPHIISAGWECYGNTSHQEWTFWAQTDDYDGLYDLRYISVELDPLYNYDYYELHIDNHDYGYFERTIGLVSFRCDLPHNVYFTVIDQDGNYDEFNIFW